MSRRVMIKDDTPSHLFTHTRKMQGTVVHSMNGNVWVAFDNLTHAVIAEMWLQDVPEFKPGLFRWVDSNPGMRCSDGSQTVRYFTKQPDTDEWVRI